MAYGKRKPLLPESQMPLERQAEERALRLITFRGHTYIQLWQKLEEDFSEDICEAVCDKMVEMGFINDRLLAEQWVEYWAKEKRWGPAKIRYELSARGVPKDLIAEILSVRAEEGQNSQGLEELLRGKYRSKLESAENDKDKNKIIASLTRRGYGYKDITAALKDFYSEIEEEIDCD